MHLRKIGLLAGVLGATLGGGLRAHAADSDARVGRALKAEKLEYETTEAGNYRVVLSFDDKRTQLVLINSSTSAFHKVDWRDVYSKAFEIKGQLTAEQANMLLKESDTNVFGAFVANESEGKTYVYYQSNVSADATPVELHNAITMVAITADEMEKKLTSKDDF